jgi:L-lactate dehydrogenase (cytochrome)/(S)-mandelate dehydrogenase
MKLSKIVNIQDMRAAARRRLPRTVFDYIDGGVEDEAGLARNTGAFADVTLTPRYLVDVAERSQKTALFGQLYDSPFGIAPTGMANLAWHDADLCLARAAAAANIPVTLSTVGSTAIEDFAAAAPDHFWFQLYAQKDRNVTGDLIRRAADAGAKGLMVTVDVPLPAKRERDIRNSFVLPPRIGMKHFVDGARRPGWALSYLRHPTPNFNSIAKYTDAGASTQELARFIASRLSQSFTWDDLKWARDAFDGPLVVKGVMSIEDAKQAKALGAEGIVLSNHGGRQLDAAPSPIEVLPALREAVGDDMAILFDSGIRRGSDIGKALALGADFCFVGRATLYGAAAAGQAGVERSLDILRDELDRFLGQSGYPDIKNLRQAEVGRNGAAALQT